MSFSKALAWSIFWIGVSKLCALGISSWRGDIAAGYFLTGYALEKVLSIDNLFVFLMVFQYFRVEPDVQRRVLNYGIIGVMVLRGILIFVGIQLVDRFEWVMYIFGVFVIYTGVIMAFRKEEGFDPETNKVIKFLSKAFTIDKNYRGKDFFTVKNGKRMVTPLFIVLMVIEVMDIFFALDSIPAVFSVTRDRFIVYSSNMLAVMGLRSMYFLLERMQKAFRFVAKGVVAILWFVGLKMLLPLIAPRIEISNTLSLSLILAILLISIVASVSIGEKPAETDVP